MRGSQVGGEVFISVDDCVRGNVLLAVRLPERVELGPHVTPLVVRMLVARRHLLDRVYVHVDVRGRVRRVEHLAEGQDEAACGVLGDRNTAGEQQCSQPVHSSGGLNQLFMRTPDAHI